MTVVIAFLCTDGVVIGCDSMITPSVGNVNVGHHKGRKLWACAHNQLYGMAGDTGQAARMRYMVENTDPASVRGHPIDYPLALTQNLVDQFTRTGLRNSNGMNIGFNSVLAYLHNGQPMCAQFLGSALQPSLLDTDHFYTALGSGKLSADPFLRFIADTFCQGGPPAAREAVFFTTWIIQHVIETNPGGVAGPIRIGALTEEDGAWSAYELGDDSIQERLEAVNDASEALREWARSLFDDTVDTATALPEPPNQSEQIA